jgi:D-hexose-6-phosphate mutarotase
MTTLSELNAQFSIPGHVHFHEDASGLIEVRIANQLGDAAISLQGGHLTHFCPQGQAPLIWLSERAKFAPGKVIRGGVPVCWPWFGPHTSDAKLPAHGIARTALWEVRETRALADGQTFVRLGLPETPASRALWPHPSCAELEITVGRTLQITLVTRNTGSAAIVVGEALHTYFAISDVAQVRIDDLDGCEFLDKVDHSTRKMQRGGIEIDQEVDRVYLNTSAGCLIEDAGLQRRIRIASQGARSTVVWNPRVDKASKMDDMAPDGYRRMVCVETGNAAENVVTVAPGEEHRMTVLYSLEALA